MSLLRTLLLKDLRRAWKNPVPWVIYLAVPLAITALLGLAFGSSASGETLGRIRFGVVDEDRSALMDFLRGAMNQQEAGRRLEPVFLDRAEAWRQVRDNQLSAVVILPAGFARNYLTGREQVRIELIKNPAQSIHPAVIEELLGALTTALNGLRQVLGPELEPWLEVINGKGDYRRVAELIQRSGERLEAARPYLWPPKVGYRRETRAAAPTAAGIGNNLFAYVLPGMAAMFFLFIAGYGMLDLHREMKLRTLARFHTLRDTLGVWLVGKAVFTCLLVLACAAIMLGGGGVLFGIPWRQPGALLLLTAAYCIFAAGFMGLFAVVSPTERIADTLVNLVAMLVALAGGCAFPSQQLPALFRDHLGPLLPTSWYVDTVRRLQFESGGVAWLQTALLTAALGVGLLLLSTLLARHRLEKGHRG